MEAGKLAPPVLQVNTRQRAPSQAETITSQSSPSALDLSLNINPFSFTPSQLSRLLNPKALAIHHALKDLEPGGVPIRFLKSLHSENALVDTGAEHTAMNLTFARKLGYNIDRKATSDNNLEREFRIPGFLDSEHPVDAVGDTGANRNAMHETFVRKRGYKIDREAASTLQIGQGKVKTIGVVHVPFRFRDETTLYLLKFHVLPKCPCDIILGSTFLRLTKTFSSAANFARRVFDRTVTRISQYYNMLYLGGSGPTFTGTIGGRPHAALADTGSKVLIMDEGFARSSGLPIIDAEEYRIKLRFADGSTARTLGMAQGVIWQFGLAHEGKSFPLDFYILKDAPSDVILSENFLLRKTQAFTEYSDYLLDDHEEEEDEDEGHIFVIRKETTLRYQGNFNGVDQLCNDVAWDQEKNLRRNEDYRISIIQDATVRGQAEAAEKLRRRQWDDAHIVTQTVQVGPAGRLNQSPPGSPGVQLGGGGGGAAQPQVTAQQNSSNMNQAPPLPTALPGNSNTMSPFSARWTFFKHFSHKRKQGP
jgi:hypothetical protein